MGTNRAIGIGLHNADNLKNCNESISCDIHSFIETDKSLLIGVPCGTGKMWSSFVYNLFRLKKPLKTELAKIDRMPVDEARNMMVKQACAHGCDYLFFMDDDMIFHQDTLKLMIEDDKDIVVAPYVTRNKDFEGERKIVAFIKNEDGKLEKFNPEKCQDSLQKIHSGGAGCMLIKRKVFKTLLNNYGSRPFQFVETKNIKGKEYMSEDVCFCDRANKEGFEVWIDMRIKPGHMETEPRINFYKSK